MARCFVVGNSYNSFIHHIRTYVSTKCYILLLCHNYIHTFHLGGSHIRSVYDGGYDGLEGSIHAGTFNTCTHTFKYRRTYIHAYIQVYLLVVIIGATSSYFWYVESTYGPLANQLPLDMAASMVRTYIHTYLNMNTLFITYIHIPYILYVRIPIHIAHSNILPCTQRSIQHTWIHTYVQCTHTFNICICVLCTYIIYQTIPL